MRGKAGLVVFHFSRFVEVDFIKELGEEGGGRGKGGKDEDFKFGQHLCFSYTHTAPRYLSCKAPGMG